MKTIYSFLAILAIATLASCNAPYGNGVQALKPNADVESLERQAPVTPAAGAGLDGYTASQYGLDNRSRGFRRY